MTHRSFWVLMTMNKESYRWGLYCMEEYKQSEDMFFFFEKSLYDNTVIYC